MEKKNYHGIVAFDVDHTLYDHDIWEITPSALTGIEKLKKNGYLVAIASGRDMKNAYSVKILDAVDPDVVIHMNGTLVETRKGEILVDGIMNPALLERVLHFCEAQNEPVGSRIEDVDYFTCPDKVREFDLKYWGFDDRNFDDPWKMLSMGLPVRSLAYFGSREHGAELMEAFPELKVLFFSREVGADVFEAEYSKAMGIRRVAEQYGIPHEKTYAFGDSLNDLEMLSDVQVGIAMGNAVPEAKEAADYITDDIGHDGVYKALEHFGLI